MNNDHEPILAALLDWLQTATQGFKTFSRREVFLTDINAQPALLLRQVGANYEFQKNIFSRTTIDAEIWIACPATQNSDLPSDTDLNLLKYSVLDAFEPDEASGRFTLGGLAFWCRVEGQSEQYPGDIGNQSLCKLPVKITVP